MWILSILAFLVVFSVLVLVHEWGHYRAAKWAGVRPEEFAIGFGKELFSWTNGETRFRLNAIPLGGYVKMTGEMAPNGEDIDPRSFGAAPVWKRIVIAIAGVVMNWLLAFVVLSGLFWAGSQPIIVNENDFMQAYERGVITFETTPEKQQMIADLLSGGITKDEIADDANQALWKEAIGSYKVGNERWPLGQAIAKGATETARVSRLVVEKVAEIPGKIIQNGALPEELSGPVGIAQITHQVVPEGFAAVLKLLAMLSISLAVMNLLPIPALDGGLLLFLGYELITRRKPHPAAQMALTYVGIGLLLLFFVAVTWQDIMRIFG